MDVSTVLTMVQTILELLDSSVMKEIGNLRSFKSQLKKMKDTMFTIKAVLVDAEEQEKRLVQRSEADNVWLEKLRDVVYEADDLFDKVAILSQRKKLADGVGAKVLLLLSHPAFIYNASREIKEMRKSLDDIAKDRRDFGSHGPNIDVGKGSIVRKLREETHSYVRDEDVFGRDDDKRALIDMLLNRSGVKDVSCVTVFGIGGLGKTTLAKLAYNDQNIQSKFKTRLWVFVSQKFEVKKILLTILEQLTNERYDGFGLEHLRIKFHQKIKGQRYMLVLDDLWTEDTEEWRELSDLLMIGNEGSKILVTTRSQKVAQVVGNGLTLPLEGLSFKDSWHLFEKLMFEEGKGQEDTELVELGKELVRRCANIPLAIRMMVSFLKALDKKMWKSLIEKDMIQVKQDGVLPVLKLSYYHLEPSLKSCFNYCALFPTDHVIEKKTLIRLWIAQGLIVPSHGLSGEDIGEQYFKTLMHRGFFQEIQQNPHGEIKSCQIPAILHNLAQDAAKFEISVANLCHTIPNNEKLRHLWLDNGFQDNGSRITSIVRCSKERLRTFYTLSPQQTDDIKASTLSYLISMCRCLRVLKIQYPHTRCYASLTLVNLLHLRYLDLSCSYELQALPRWLTDLHNLQTLKLDHCEKLKKLPQDLRKLVNLEYLEVNGCHCLTHMPPAIGNLTGLQSLPMFVIGRTSLQEQVPASDLDDLKALINIKGSLEIKFQKVPTDNAKVGGGRYIKSMENLTDICLNWIDVEANVEDHEALLKELEPHINLKSFHLRRYPGVRFPTWDSLVNSGVTLSKLAEIALSNCTRLQNLPSLSQLPHLKTLDLVCLDNLEYIEDSDSTPPASCCSTPASDDSSFFPSLDILKLESLPKLRGYRRSARVTAALTFPQLRVLQVRQCPLLTSLPLSQNVEDLELIEYNESLNFFDFNNKKVITEPSASYSISKLKRLIIDDVGCLNSWHAESFRQLCYMEIYNTEVESLSTFEKVFQRCLMPSLLRLDIFCCSELRSLSGGGLEHLTALETLRFLDLHSLSFNKEDVMPWKSLHNLGSLECENLPLLVNLPEGMQNLISLRYLRISNCPSLETIPIWMSRLHSLESLNISGCSAKLEKKCCKITGECWYYIEHIPQIRIQCHIIH